MIYILRESVREPPWEIRQSCGIGNKQAKDNTSAQGLTLNPNLKSKDKPIVAGILFSGQIY